MVKKTAIALTLLSLCVSGSQVSFACSLGPGPAAAHEQNDEKATAPTTEVCPVSGEVVDKNSKITYEYKGKTYHFCCPSCIDEFKKDPEKYINTLKKQGGTKS